MMLRAFLINGFLPSEDPLSRLPKGAGNFLNAEFNLIASQLSLFISKKMLREAIDVLNKKYANSPLITIDRQNLQEVNCAFVMLTMLVQAYLWEQTDKPALSIPRILSINISSLIERHPRIPVLTYADYVLYNWRRIDKKKGITLDNIEPIVTFTGHPEEAWFIKIHVVVEAAFSEALAAAVNLYSLAEKTVTPDMKAPFCTYFTNMAQSIEKATNVLEKMYDNCSSTFFFNVLRPYLEGTAKIDGVTFDLPSAQMRVNYRGSSGAQSSAVPALDAILNIQHPNDKMAVALYEFLDYMPSAHKELILLLKQNKLNAALEVLGEPLAERVQAIGMLWQFRLKHRQLPAEYIIQPAREKNLPVQQVSGTGSTNIGLFLTKRAKNTLEAAIKQGWTPQAKL